MTEEIKEKLLEWAEIYNDVKYFQEDPISFPRHFVDAMKNSNKKGSQYILQDVEIAAIFSAHFAWGRRAMIVRDCERLFDQMNWKPYDYVMSGDWRNDNTSIHRTIKWSEVASICGRLRDLYSNVSSLQHLSIEDFRTKVYGQKEDKNAANKKINIMRRWMVRRDGRVDLGLWKDCSQADLLIPLDIHVYQMAVEVGVTNRKQKNLKTVMEITEAFDKIFPGDPCKGDFALFGYGIDKQ